MSTIALRRPVPPGAGRRAVPLLTASAHLPPALLVATAVVVALLRAASLAPSPAAGLVVLLAGLLLGLPHGALDVDRITAGRPPRTQLAVVVAYVAGVGAAFGAWLAYPAVVLGLLLLLAVVHFGLSDLTEVGLAGIRPPAVVRLAMVGAYGGLPVALPFALAPDRTRPLLDKLTGGAADPVLQAARVVLPVVAAAGLITMVWALRRRHWRVAFEVGALAVAFASVPPLIAFGVWFAGWHALRQSVTLVREVAGPAGAARPAARQLARRAVIPTLGALGVIAVFVIASGVDLPAADLALLLSVTVPHSVVSAYADAHPPDRRAGRTA